MTTRLSDASRATLYALAQERQVPGRASMSKAELRDALSGGEHEEAREEERGQERQPASRYEAFAGLAARAASGELVMLPRMLVGEDRRLHVRQTVREDHDTRIARHDEGAGDKFDKLSGSLFSFFRGTALLFYRDCAGMDAWMPTVLTLGDVHPENFGVMPSADNVPIFGVNDFDEACYAPFTWDLKRGAVGFMLGAQEEGGKSQKKQRKIARCFVRGYIAGISRYAREAGEERHQLRIDNSPEVIRTLIEDSLEDRAEWLADDYSDEFRRGFRNDDELVPLSSRRGEFQELLERHVRENGIEVPARAGGLRVKDVAVRKGQGTASLGLARYYLMVEGPRADGTDDLIIEVKQARRSALAGLVPPSRYGVDGAGARIGHAQAVQLVKGDVFYGGVDHDGLSFMVRERAPFRDDIDLDDLSTSDWKKYAHVCGATLAHSHALSDEVGEVDHDIEPEILAAIGSPELFVDDMVRWACEAADRVRADHDSFRADHALGAFQSVDVVYR